MIAQVLWRITWLDPKELDPKELDPKELDR